MDDKNKPYKTLKELCKEAGLQPIPYTPSAIRVNYHRKPRTDRQPRRTDWACICGWIGKKKDLAVKNKKWLSCPSCGGAAGIATFPTNGKVK